MHRRRTRVAAHGPVERRDGELAVVGPYPRIVGRARQRERVACERYIDIHAHERAKRDVLERRREREREDVPELPEKQTAVPLERQALERKAPERLGALAHEVHVAWIGSPRSRSQSA